jgi:hypothetical protein
MPSVNQTKAVIVSGVCLLGGVVFMTTTYIPQYASIGKERREAYLKDGKVIRPEIRRPGSMYENMNTKSQGGGIRKSE